VYGALVLLMVLVIYLQCVDPNCMHSELLFCNRISHRDSYGDWVLTVIDYSYSVRGLVKFGGAKQSLLETLVLSIDYST